SFSTAMQNATRDMQKMGKKLQATGKSMSTYLTAPLAALGAVAIKMSGDFEASMNRLSAITGATGTDLKALSKVAQDLGVATQFSASQAAEAMTFLGMAGFD